MHCNRSFPVAIILPTIWDYLRERFEAEHWLLGICITASSLCNVVAGPIVGAIYDKTHACRLLVMFTTLATAAGTCSPHTIQIIVIMHCRLLYVFCCNITIHDIRRSTTTR